MTGVWGMRIGRVELPLTAKEKARGGVGLVRKTRINLGAQ